MFAQDIKLNIYHVMYDHLSEKIKIYVQFIFYLHTNIIVYDSFIKHLSLCVGLCVVMFNLRSWLKKIYFHYIDLFGGTKKMYIFTI